MPGKAKHIVTEGYTGLERRKRGTKLEAFPPEQRDMEDVIRRDPRDVGNHKHFVTTRQLRGPGGNPTGFVVTHAKYDKISIEPFGPAIEPSGKKPKGKHFEKEKDALAHHQKLLQRINPRKKRQK